MKNRLQIKYYMPVSFPYEREEAIEYIKMLFSTDAAVNKNPRKSLPAEPIAVFYGDDVYSANVILAIGRGGDGSDYTMNVPYFLIDTAKLDEDLATTNGILDEVKEIAYQAKADIDDLKKAVAAAETEIKNLWAKIGTEADNAGHKTIYGYINSKVGAIMGGEPVDGLATINSIGNAIKRLRLRITNNETKITELRTSMNEFTQDLMAEVSRSTAADAKLQEDMNKVSSELQSLKENEITALQNEDKAIRRDFAQADKDLQAAVEKYADQAELDAVQAAKDYTDTRETEIKKYVDQAESDAVQTASDNAKKDIQTAIDAEILRSDKYADQAESDAVQAAKDYTDARELVIKADSQDKANTAKDDAVNAAKVYVNDREVEIKKYADDKDGLVREDFAKADENLKKQLTVTSKDNSVIVGAPTVEGTDIKVNIDGQTIVRDEATGLLSVASDKLVQYRGENAITVSDVESGVKTVRLVINENDKILSNEAEGLFSTLSLKWVKGEENGGKEQIQLLGKDPLNPISTIDVAEFIKDGMLDDVQLNNEDVNNPKLVFIFNSAAGKQTIELPVKDILYVYEAGEGLKLDGSVFGIKLSETNESEFLIIANDGVKLQGVRAAIEKAKADAIDAFKADDKIITDKLTALTNRVGVNETSISGLNNNLAAEIGNRQTADADLKGLIDGNGTRITTLEGKAHEHANKTVLDGVTAERVALWDAAEQKAKNYTDVREIAITTAYKDADAALEGRVNNSIAQNAEKIEKLNGDLKVEGSVKSVLYKSVIGDVITTITPDDAAKQTLLKRIDVNGEPYFYASNNSADMLHGTRVLSEIIDEIIAENTLLKEENAKLLETMTLFESKLAELEEKIKNIDIKIDYDEVRKEVVPAAVDEAKKAIINPNVFKAVVEETSVAVDTTNFTVTYGFSDDALFMADYNDNEPAGEETPEEGN